jgi:hypothetical protein
VSAEKLGTADASSLAESVVVHVAFANGSVGSLQYLANGDPALDKERIEVFAGGVAAVIDDFRSLEIARAGKRNVRRARGQDKGHREALRAFVDVVEGSAAAVEPSASVFWSSALTLQVPVALGLGQPVTVELPEALGGLGAAAATTSPSAERPLERSSTNPER